MERILLPFTPFHLGPALLLGLLLLRYIDFPTFVVANIIVDIESFLVLALGLNYPLHGFLHTFLGGSIIALLLAMVMNEVRELLSPLLSSFRLEQETSFKGVLLASVFGVYLHILLDAPLYIDIQPFYPLDTNPFYVGSVSFGAAVYSLCTWCFLGAAVIYAIRLLLVWRMGTKISS